MDNFWRIVNSNEMITPYEYIREQCNALSDATNGKIVAKISEYDGAYKSKYKKLPVLGEKIYEEDNSAFWNGFKVPDDYDVQSDLGDGNTKFVYEFFISALATPKYKYRIMFIAFDVSIYPVEISLEKSIADEINDGECEFILSREEEFLGFLKNVLGSKKVSGVINNLINITRQKERVTC